MGTLSGGDARRDLRFEERDPERRETAGAGEKEKGRRAKDLNRARYCHYKPNHGTHQGRGQPESRNVFDGIYILSSLAGVESGILGHNGPIGVA